MNRIALYLCAGRAKASAADLRQYFQSAQEHHLRIVTVVREAPGATDRRRPVLKRLAARMEAGEFEAIVSIGEQIAPAARPPRVMTLDQARRARVAGAR